MNMSTQPTIQIGEQKKDLYGTDDTFNNGKELTPIPAEPSKTHEDLSVFGPGLRDLIAYSLKGWWSSLPRA